jgi:hypothetical protein
MVGTCGHCEHRLPPLFSEGWTMVCISESSASSLILNSSFCCTRHLSSHGALPPSPRKKYARPTPLSVTASKPDATRRTRGWCWAWPSQRVSSWGRATPFRRPPVGPAFASFALGRTAPVYTPYTIDGAAAQMRKMIGRVFFNNTLVTLC